MRSPTRPAPFWRASRRASRAAFNLAPITLDRPFFYAVLRLAQLGTLLRRLEMLPQAEIGALVNLAVLAQAAVIAVLVLLVPLARRAGCACRSAAASAGRLLYFPALGLGFLFIEIFLIEQASLWLNDRTSGFALVLTGMLIFSGLGSMLSGALQPDARGSGLGGRHVGGVGWCVRGAGAACSR